MWGWFQKPTRLWIRPPLTTEGRSSMIQLVGHPPVFVECEPEIEQSRANEAPVSPRWAATPLRAPMTPSSSLPSPSECAQPGRTSSCFSLGHLHFQATVESAPPTPSIESEKAGQDDLPASAASPGLVEGQQEGGNEDDHTEGNGFRENEDRGHIGEPPALVYVRPSPQQLESGVPLTGWLCDPEWLRRRLSDLRLGDRQENR
jgi:hypothetical protein